MTAAPRFLPAGDAALVVEFGDVVDRVVSDRVLALSGVVRTLPGVLITIPTFRSLLVQYDPLRTRARDLEAAIRTKLRDGAAVAKSVRRWHLPACYDERLAPDLAEVAERTNHSVADVVRLHSGTEYHVYVVGFAPGYGYLGDLPQELFLPRRAEPRVKVPAGSVSIALNLTGVYPQESPGGWHLIAACPVRFFDIEAARPAVLAAGDKVLFEPVDVPEYERIRAAVARRDFTPTFEEIAA